MSRRRKSPHARRGQRSQPREYLGDHQVVSIILGDPDEPCWLCDHFSGGVLLPDWLSDRPSTIHHPSGGNLPENEEEAPAPTDAPSATPRSHLGGSRERHHDTQ